MSANPSPNKRTVRKRVRRLALRPGQPDAKSKLDDDVQQKICNAVSSGQTFECAASLVHIDRTTLNDWRARGQQDPDSRYGEFNRALEAALLASETMMVHKILSADDWKAAKWILKNRFPERYRERYELSGPGGQGIPLEHTGNSKFTVEIICPPPPPGAKPKEPGDVDHHRAPAAKNGAL